MKVITAPNPVSFGTEEPFIFIGGGITDCPDWQADIIDKLRQEPGTLLNPRRPNFNVRDPKASDAQIKWEADKLHAADAVLFWFPCETLCPITLFELGTYAAYDAGVRRTIFVGCHPDYARKIDVETQLEIRRPDVVVVNNLDALANQVKDYIRDYV